MQTNVRIDAFKMLDKIANWRMNMILRKYDIRNDEKYSQKAADARHKKGSTLKVNLFQ